MNRFARSGTIRQLAVFSALLAVPAVLAQPTASAPIPNVPSDVADATPDAAEKSEIVQLSPFEVRSDTRGYYSANTMSGTRLNTKIEDLGSSISVVTKDQMLDLGLLDINDVFSYEVSTEGTGNFTDFSIDRRGNVVDNVVDNPQGANRVRGMGPANNALGNFATSGRMPIDPLLLDSIEISRGPNSNIFGLGNASGTVNVVPATANLSRNSAQAQARIDSRRGNRESFEFNRVLVPGKLAFRASGSWQRDEFIRKPSGVNTDRYNLMLKWQPYRNTTVKGAYYTYKAQGTRTNEITPRDAISFWKASGSPTWDPVTYTAKINGIPVGTYTSSATLPAYFRTNDFMNRSAILTDQTGIGWWGVQQGASGSNPSSNSGNVRMVESSYDNTIRTSQPLFSTWPATTDRSLYDWKNINLSAINWVDDQDRIATAEVEQIVFNNSRQLVAVQAGWMRETAKRYNRNLFGRAAGAGVGGLLQVDVNERLTDGTPNPYFLRTYLNIPEPISIRDTLQTDVLRGQVVYKIDFTQDTGWRSWLGEHRIVGYSEYRDSKTRVYRYRDVMRDQHAFIAAGNPRGNQAAPAGATVARAVYRYYVGDNQGSNVDYAPTNFTRGVFPFHWYNGTTKQWVTENAELGEVATTDNSGGTQNQWNELKTAGAVLQSRLLKGRVVPTVGVRQDKSYTQFGATPALSADGLDFDFDQMRRWSGTWTMRSGYTKSAGIVVRPLSWLSLYVNKSDSFTLTTPSQNILRQELPNPTGDGKDYGFSLNLFDGKLVIRANQYETSQVNSPFGQSGTYAQRILSMDFVEFNNGSGPRLNEAVRNWTVADAANHGQTLTEQQIQDTVYKTLQLTPADFAAFQRLPVTDVSDLIGRGNEVEINFNPTKTWTLRMNVARQIAINSRLSPALLQWANQRLSVWQNVRNPVTGALWWDTAYSSSNTPSTFYANSVVAPIRLDQALDGKSRPQVRKYRVNLTTNYRLSGITENKILKNVSVGGSYRWEDKGAIGFYGVQQFPAQITDLDPNRPVWDKAHYYVDTFVNYRMKLFQGKVAANFRFLVRNLGEHARLQPIDAYPNGVAETYRITDPQQFIFSASFDL